MGGVIMNLKKISLAASVLAAFFVATPAMAACNDGKDRRVTIINDTSFTIMYLYGSNVGEKDWQEDVLGDDVVQPGGKVTVNFDDGTCYCYFDFKAVFDDESETIRERYNVCTESSWRIYE